MKRIFFRVAVLGTVAALGLIALAQTQRSQSSPGSGAEAGTAFVADNTAASSDSAAPSGENPLRPAAMAPAVGNPTVPDLLPGDDGAARPLAQDAPASDPPEREHPSRGAPPSDPFARLQGNAAGGPVRAAAARADAAAGQDARRGQSDMAPDAGPVIVPPTDMDRAGPAASAPSRLAGPPPGGDRYLPPPTTDTQEPRRFSADPASAMPKGASAAGSFSDVPSGPPSRAPTTPAEQPSPAYDNAGAPEGTGQPGGKQLDGPQSPQLTIEKTCPREVQVGKPATFRITVRNSGRCAAGNVEVRDEIPRGTRLVETAPQATRGPRGELVWTLGTIKPGELVMLEGVGGGFTWGAVLLNL